MNAQGDVLGQRAHFDGQNTLGDHALRIPADYAHAEDPFCLRVDNNLGQPIGGIHRDGAHKPRGITPPDDIRHRALKWDHKTQMWVERSFTRINEKFTPRRELAAQYFGESQPTLARNIPTML